MNLTNTEDKYTASLDSLGNDRAYAKAAALGLAVVVPDEYTLTLDIDAPVLTPQYLAGLTLLNQFFTVEKEVIKPSKSGNLHVYLTLEDPLTVMERIALQAILGSDPKREFFSFARAQKELGEPILMFETTPVALPDLGIDIWEGENAA